MAKTRKSLKKRFKITKKGKVVRRNIGKGHYRAKKSGAKIRKTRKSTTVSNSLAKKIKRLVG